MGLTRSEPRAILGALRRSLGAGLLGGLVASVCCVPAALAFAFGLGGSAFLVGLGLYNLPFVALGLAITALAGGLLTRRRGSACATGVRPSPAQSLLPALVGFFLAYLGLVYGLVPLLYQLGLGT